MKRVLSLGALLLLLVGCNGFINDAHKSIYTAAMLSDGAMTGYAVYWKTETNKVGATQALLDERDRVTAVSKKVGSAIAVADQTLTVYEGNAGTNTTTSAVVTALIETAVSQAGELAAEVGALTGNTNIMNLK